MVENWFATPIYYNDIDNDTCIAAKEEIINAYNTLEELNILTNYSGTSSLSFSTDIKDVIDHFNMVNTRKLVISECSSYLNFIGISFNEIEMIDNWVIGYKGNEFQGEHDHGYIHNYISGIFYAETAPGSSPIIFSHPNPYNQHITISNSNTQYAASIVYKVTENRVLIFPSYLRHRVPGSSKLDGRRLALVFNVRIKN